MPSNTFSGLRGSCSYEGATGEGRARPPGQLSAGD